MTGGIRLLCVIGLLLLASCASDGGSVADRSVTTTATTTGGDTHPDVIAVEATYDDDTGTWSFAVTMSSPYDTPERYADGWRIIGEDGDVFGIHTLAHDHANEQPFTRRQTGVVIPEGTATVTVEGRDQANGFGGGTVTVALEASS